MKNELDPSKILYLLSFSIFLVYFHNFYEFISSAGNTIFLFSFFFFLFSFFLYFTRGLSKLVGRNFNEKADFPTKGILTSSLIALILILFLLSYTIVAENNISNKNFPNDVSLSDQTKETLRSLDALATVNFIGTFAIWIIMIIATYLFDKKNLIQTKNIAFKQHFKLFYSIVAFYGFYFITTYVIFWIMNILIFLYQFAHQ